MNNVLRKKGGFSISEVVIAMAVIVLVGIASIMFMDLSIKSSVETGNKTQAQNFAENTLACFKAAESPDEFEANMSFFLGETFFAGIEDESGTNTYHYDYESGRYQFTAKISVNFGSDGEGSYFTIAVERHGEDIIAFDYTKYQ